MLPFRFFPTGDGTERQALALSVALARRGVQVHVATARLGGLARSAVVEGIPVDRLMYSPDRNRVRRLAKYTFMTSLTSYLLRNASEYDVFHCHMAGFQVIPAVLVGRLKRRPVLVKIACAGPNGDIGRLRNGKLAGELGPVCATLLRQAELVALSREIKRELGDQGYQHIHTIPNGVDSRRFHPATSHERLEARQRFGLPLERVVVGFLGRLHEQKGVDVLIKAWGANGWPDRGGLLLIAGEGEDEMPLRSLAEGFDPSGTTIRFVGRVDPVPFLQALDAFVLPSRYEGMPNALLEAMATGLPCLATQIGGSEDLLDHDHSGLLVPADDPTYLAAALDTLADPVVRKRLGEAARCRTEAEFSLEVVASRYEELYHRLVSRSDRRNLGQSL